MSETWYKVTKFGPEAEPITVARSTDCFVITTSRGRERREAKESDWCWYFPTEEEAAAKAMDLREKKDASNLLHSKRMAAEDLYAALEHITEYWNRDQNESAMADALWHIIETAEGALAKARGEL